MNIIRVRFFRSKPAIWLIQRFDAAVPRRIEGKSTLSALKSKEYLRQKRQFKIDFTLYQDFKIQFKAPVCEWRNIIILLYYLAIYLSGSKSGTGRRSILFDHYRMGDHYSSNP